MNLSLGVVLAVWVLLAKFERKATSGYLIGVYAWQHSHLTATSPMQFVNSACRHWVFVHIVTNSPTSQPARVLEYNPLWFICNLLSAVGEQQASKPCEEILEYLNLKVVTLIIHIIKSICCLSLFQPAAHTAIKKGSTKSTQSTEHQTDPTACDLDTANPCTIHDVSS